jgi:hypothetical protein
MALHRDEDLAGIRLGAIRGVEGVVIGQHLSLSDRCSAYPSRVRRFRSKASRKSSV